MNRYPRKNAEVRTFVFDIADDPHQCTITIECWHDDDALRHFSAQGTILDMSHREPGDSSRPLCVAAGQCLPTMLEWFPQLSQCERFMTLYALWDRWHLHDMCAGTPEQMEYLRKTFGAVRSVSYDDACQSLKTVGLYTVDLDGKPYTYGHAWIFEELPDEVVTLLSAICDDENPDWSKRTLTVPA